MVTDSVVARLKKDWKGDIRAFDEGEIHLIKNCGRLIGWNYQTVSSEV
jgi:hypothetical protein